MKPKLMCCLLKHTDGLPFFVVPSAGSSHFSLVMLSRTLQPKRPFFSFGFAGLEDSQPTHKSIQEMAAVYAGEIMSAEHDNSLVLGGHCFGGLVALEMASRLEAEGREVAAVILLETIYSSTGEETSPNKETDLESENTAQVRPKDAAEHIFRKTYEQLALLPSIVAERFGQVYWEQYGMSMYYRPQPIQADIVLLRTSTYSEELFLGLHGLSLGDFTEHTVPGDSVSMLSPPYVKVVGAKIDNALAPYERR